MQQDQCNEPQDERQRGAHTIRLHRPRAVIIHREVIPELTVEQLGAAVIVLDWIDSDPEPFGPAVTPERLADRIGCDADHAEGLLAALHNAGLIHRGCGPLPASAYPPVVPDPSMRPKPRPVMLRNAKQPPEWSGPWPLHVGTATPKPGDDIAYVLIDERNKVAYVGSTDSFHKRFEDHAKTKRWSKWRAYLCDDRDGAYAFEHHLNLQLRPYLNPRSDAMARGAYARVAS